MEAGAGRAVASVLVGVATIVVIVAVSVAPFLSPWWVSFEQGRAGAIEATGYSPAELRSATDAILSDLVLGPPAFDAIVGGEPVLNERERAHMRDVRGVFMGLFVVALVAVAVLAIAGFRLARPAIWQGVRGGALALAAAVVLGGVVALVAFETAFEVFHRIFFAGGTYTFDPSSERLVQLFPFSFWFETSVVVGAVMLVASALVALVATARLRRNVPARAARAAHPLQGGAR